MSTTSVRAWCDGSALDRALSRLDPAAAGRQRAGTLVLRSDRLTPAGPAAAVPAAADRPS
ncbi:hypothetical protein WHI96_16655 [Pseudonocardia tropica]|uniref:Uncharacterized protein n=1 Tax=Pseudonocardia tropica TaxID=681289 RepID=A0ABV1JZB1_9PSEU